MHILLLLFFKPGWTPRIGIWYTYANAEECYFSNPGVASFSGKMCWLWNAFERRHANKAQKWHSGNMQMQTYLYRKRRQISPRTSYRSLAVKKSFIIFGILTIFAIVIFGAIFWVKSSLDPRSSTENFQSFLVTKGASAETIAQKLESGGFIKSAFAFKLYVQVTGKSRAIGSGEYSISPSMSVPEVLKALTSAPLELWVTIPEGLRREEIAGKFIEGLGKKDEDASTFRTEFLSESDGKEGFLFPDTYLFPREVSASVVVKRMLDTFDVKTADYSAQINNSKLTLNQIVTLASILERETVTDEERPVVAGILLNRFDIGMPLQADATVQYAMANVRCKSKPVGCDWWPRPILRDDLDIDSPFNTYKYGGIPPSPIANPGLSALSAAISPADTPYFYYIHDSDEKIHYAKTLDEHNQNVRVYLGK